MYFNYNPAAFGNNISSGGKVSISYNPSEGYICGEKDGTMGAIDVYGSYVQNDNTASRFTFTFSQTFGLGSMAANNVTHVATKLFHLKIEYNDVTQDPLICFESGMFLQISFIPLVVLLLH